jgi:hypothetical protein
MLTALYQALLLFLQLGKGMLTGPVYAAMQLRSVMVELGGMITAQLVTVGQMLGSAWQVVKAGGMVRLTAGCCVVQSGLTSARHAGGHGRHDSDFSLSALLHSFIVTLSFPPHS